MLWTVALLEALLLGGHTWQVVCTVVFQVSGLYYGSHLVMVGWVASLVVIADDATSTELSSLSCELFYLYMTCMYFYVLYVCVFVVCVRLAVNVSCNVPPTGLFDDVKLLLGRA